MADTISNFLLAVIGSWLSWVGGATTVLGVLALWPDLEGRFMNSPAVEFFRKAWMPVAFAFFLLGAFDAYRKEYDLRMDAETRLIQIESSAEGMLATSVRTQHLPSADYIFVDFENTSPSKAIVMSLDSVEISAGGKSQKLSGGDCCAPLAPSRKTSISFKFETLENIAIGQKLNVSTHGNYGFAGSVSSFKMCESLICDLAIGKNVEEMKFLACQQKGCR